MSLTLEPPRRRATPILQNGDHLSRAEFEELYQRTSEKTKAELIEGVVYMASPVTIDMHAEQDANILGWLTCYRILTRHVKAASNGSFRVNEDNEVQPDQMLYIDSRHGGQSIVDEEGYLTGIPELVIEVASSSKSIDLGKKKRVYENQSIPEYLVWRVQDDVIDWFVRTNAGFTALKVEAGLMKSTIFPGLWLNVPAILAGDMAAVFSTVQQGCQTPEHAAFVAQLNK